MKPIRLLLIEDEPVFAVAVKATLLRNRREKFELEIVGWLKDALERLQSRDVDIILLDLTLPDSQGLDTLKEIRKQSSLTPVIVLTGREDDIAVEALKMGAQDYLVKGKLDGDLLTRAIRYAIERNKLIEERDEFIATLSHDLRNPLIGANRILQVMYRGDAGAISAEHSTLLHKIEDTNHHLLSMIQNLLDVYRLEKDINVLVMAHLNLLSLVTTCVEQVRPLATEKQLTIESNLTPISQPIVADQGFIRRVVHNLLDNAIKFTPPGGKVMVNLFEERKTSVLEISDTGPGITEAEQRNLFRRFGTGSHTTTRTGTGLGLFVCKQIVEMHGGSISFRANAGATFVVQLPFERAD